MAKWIVASFALVAGLAYWASGAAARELDAREHAWAVEIEEGDLVFQDLACGERCALIRSITGSRYSHVGVVRWQDGERVVWEALRPVGLVPLADWVRRGIREEVAIYRPSGELRNLNEQLGLELHRMRGLPYDGDYQWDDEAIYCSELIAKAYERALGHALIEPQPVSLGRHERRVSELSEGRLTSETLMVSPADLVRSGLFERLVDELE